MPEFLKKIQSLPEERKKIILWSIVAIIALILFVWWLNNFQTRLQSLQTEGGKVLKLPSWKDELKNLPKF